jgi:hypothetical protein
MRPLSSSLSLAAFAAGALHASLATAVGPLPPHGDATRWEFSLQGGRADMSFDYNGTRVDTQLDTASLALRQRIAERVHLGVLGGWSALTQTDNPGTAGLKPTGFHAGISMDVDIVTRERWSAFGSVAYTYQRVDDDDAGQSVRLDWDEWRARLGGSVGLGVTRFYGGASYGAVDGTQRNTGATDATTHFEISGEAGGFLGVDMRVDQDGYIGVEGRTGLDDGWLLYFRHRL